MKKYLIFICILIIISQKNYAQKNKNWNYPVIKPDTSIDYYFGKKVIDPYRNLEDIENGEV